ncbi:hypothetical protein NQ315_001351 [Exocentrus adspersus]|uniref:Fibronectin type-III domain-containing protein n=1 Tax=Exocentrus adspersus TaxID=1586481 RepID=A0AAV8WHE6_9CUCU|nr:hypothetical protein NQ315_001351 [Exocentrus adspersus]
MTMVAMSISFTLLVIYFFAFDVQGEECVAGAVLNLQISVEANLTWQVSENEPCDIEQFQVDLLGDREDEYHFKVNSTFVDLSFLEICEQWQFMVTPISNGIAGYERRITGHIPLPSTSSLAGADLSLKYFNVTQVEPRILLLQWDLNNHTHGDCTLRYRITVTDQDFSIIRDRYVTGYSEQVFHLSPCGMYHIAIRPFNIGYPTIEGPMSAREIELPPHPQERPVLRELTIGPTTIHTVWELENYFNQRCPVRSLHVDGGSQFNVEVPVSFPTEERLPVEVDLKGLKPDNMYFLNVSVENMGGLSSSTLIGVQTLELEPSRD